MKVMAAIQVALPVLLRRRWPHTRRRRRRSSPSHDRVIEIRDKIPSSLLDLLREGHLGVIDFGLYLSLVSCEMDPDAAMSINVPTDLVKWLSSFEESSLLIHLSTDQVYEGTKSFYKEEDETLPVNVYGKSKVEAEHYISAHCQNYAILRSSIIYGPQTISPVPKSLPSSNPVDG